MPSDNAPACRGHGDAAPGDDAPGDDAAVAPVAPHPALLAVMCLLQFTLIAGMTIVTVSLPAMRTELAFTGTDLQWVVTAYGLTFGGFLVLGGRLVDVLGERRLLVFGLLTFAVGSAVCATAGEKTVLVAGRALQGIGAAAVAPASLAAVTSAFTGERDRRLALGLWAAVGAAGATLGNILGGVLTSTTGWRSIFLVNLPVCLFAVVVTPRLIPARATRTPERVGALGAFLVTSGLALVVLALGQVQSAGLSAWQSWGPGLLACALLGGFVSVQMTSAHPLVPRGTFTRATSVALVLIVLAGASNIGAYYFCSLYLQDRLGYSALQTGFAFSPWAALIAASAYVVPRLQGRVSPRVVVSTSFLLVSLGTAWLAVRMTGSAQYATDLLPAFVVLGLGAGASSVSAMLMALSTVRNGSHGVSAALLSSAGQMGSAFAVAVLVSVAALRAASVQTAGQAERELLGMQLGLWTNVAVAVLAAGVAACVLPGSSRPGPARRSRAGR